MVEWLSGKTKIKPLCSLCLSVRLSWGCEVGFKQRKVSVFSVCLFFFVCSVVNLFLVGFKIIFLRGRISFQ
jgi:hypothetical protein